MTKEFFVDGVCYVIGFTEKNELYFYADVRKSTKSVYNPTTFYSGFWDEPPERIWTTTGTGHVFNVKRKITEFLEHTLNRYSPYYLSFVALEERRLSLYEKFAHRIGKQYGYYVARENLSFRFSRYEPG